MSDVAWGGDVYVAAQDAAGALQHTRRAGAAAVHEDTDELVARIADALLGLQFKTWDFGDSVAFEALIAASAHLGTDRWESFAYGWGRAWATRAMPFARLDCTVPGRALTLIAERHDDGQLRDTLVALARFLRERPALDGVFTTWDSSPLLSPYGDAVVTSRDSELLAMSPAGVFVDCLHFDPPFFTALGRITADDDLVAEGVAQARGYIRLLQRSDGLFDHFVLEGVTGTFGPGWGRGQGWAALGLIETLHELRARRRSGGDDRFDADGRALAAAAERLLARMGELQRADGHWEVVVDVPGSGDEFSTAAFMAYAMDLAVSSGIGDHRALTPVAQRARRAVLGSLDARGQLREVSAAVYASTVPSHYAAVPRGYVVPWGQGPALLAMTSGTRRGATR